MRHLACTVVVAMLSIQATAQEQTIPTPKAVTIEGIPPIPQSIADGLARYGQFRQARLQAWHPTKRQILIATTLGAVPQLYAVDGPGRDRRQLTWLPRGMTGASPSFDPADGNVFVLSHEPAGGELRSLYRYDLTAGEPALLVESKTRYVPVWARQGKWLAYDSAERNGKDRDLYAIQPADPKTKRKLADFNGAFSPQDWSPDGQTLLALELPSNTETYIWRVDVKTGEHKALTPRDGEKAQWQNARFSSDGKRVYAMSDRAGGDPRIWRCDLAACTWTPVTPEGLFVDPGSELLAGPGGFEISPDGQLLAVVIDRGGSSDLQVFDLATMKPRTMPAIPKGAIGSLRWRPGSRELAFTLASVKAQGDVYSVDTSLGTLTRWTTSETVFNSEALPAPEIVEWKSFDGLMISGILFRPSARFAGPRPVIVQIHGGPDQRERARWLGRSNYFLNELGVAILFPNVRGSIGFGRKFSQMDDGKGRDGAIKDIGALLDWIATRPEFDRNRVLLTGPSYGGWLALQAGAVYNDRIRGIIAGAGQTNLVTFLEKTDAARQDNRRVEYGDERDPDMRAYLTSISPVTNASKLRKPTFILHPGKDIRVPVEQARELVNAIKANNAPVWYAEFADAGHDGFPGNAVNNDWMLASWILFVKTFVVN